MAVQPIAVMKDAPHPNAARLFVDWALSNEGQRVIVDTLGDYSGRADVPSPAFNPPFNELKVSPVADWQGLVDAGPTFQKEWPALFGAPQPS